MHDASNNAVAHDDRIGPPRHLQWQSGPRWGRHHDHMASVSAMVTARGRVFSIVDEGARVSPQLPADWKLVARDAFNGVLLWKLPIERWHDNLWPLKSGPANLPRRLVAGGDTVYVTLGIEAPVTALDAATGKTVLREYADTSGAEEIVQHRRRAAGVGQPNAASTSTPIWQDRSRGGQVARPSNHLFADHGPHLGRRAVADDGPTAIVRDSGFRRRKRATSLGKAPGRVLPLTLAADADQASTSTTETKMVALDLSRRSKSVGTPNRNSRLAGPRRPGAPILVRSHAGRPGTEKCSLPAARRCTCPTSVSAPKTSARTP